MRALTDLDLQNSAADFRLISDRVVRVIQALPQGRQVFRLLIPSLGFSHAVVYYTAAERFGGTTKYTLRKMINLSTDSIIGFTTKPLTLSIRIGLAVSLLAVVGFVYVIITYFTGQALEGWASVLSTVLLMFGMLFVILGVFGLYLGAILRSSMARPTYILTEGTGRPAGPGSDGGNR
jgi:dolichol-phosphate mannosyltransferase